MLLFIEGSGTFQLINAGYNSEPSKVLVDGSHRNDCGRSCSITAGGNHQITVQFNNIITSWDIMFQDIGSIKKIDLSNFISNSVTTMVSMFQRCSNLETVIFGNIDVSSITTMFFSFESCPNLISIDFSNMVFTNLNRMIRTFQSCISLVSVNLKKYTTHFS